MKAQDLIQDHIAHYGSLNEDLTNEYSIKLLFKSNYVENDIYTIHYEKTDSSRRMGWIFPSHSIGSNNHNFFGNIHYAYYAKIAASYFSKDTDLDISENSHTLILKDEFLLNNNLCIENSILPLVGFGYYQCGDGNTYTNDYFKTDHKETNKIILEKFPDYNNLNSYTTKLFNDILPSASDLLSRFICTYQIFEMFMEFAYNEKIDQLRSSKSTIGTIREKINKYSSERKLLKLIASDHNIRTALINRENQLIRKIFTTYKDESYYNHLDLSSFIYDIRNCIVHNYYKYELSPVMKEIADILEGLLIEYLQKPSLQRAITKN